MLFIDPKFIVGQKFVPVNSVAPVEVTCIGYAQNDTFLLVGTTWDQASNRTVIKTYKMTEVSFVGKLPT